MSDTETTIARWDALTYDGSAPGRNVPSLHIYLRPTERSGETPGAARRLFQDFISRFYSGPPFLTPLEKLRDTANYALEEAKRSRGTEELGKIQIAVAILDRAEGEMHLFRNGPVRLGLAGYKDKSSDEPTRFETIMIGIADGLALLDGTLPPDAVDTTERRGDHGRLIYEGQTAGIWIPILQNDMTRPDRSVEAEPTPSPAPVAGESEAAAATPAAPPPAPAAEEERVSVQEPLPLEEDPAIENPPSVPLSSPQNVVETVFEASIPAPQVGERIDRKEVESPPPSDAAASPARPIRNPILLASIFLLISLVTLFWNRANREGSGEEEPAVTRAGEEAKPGSPSESALGETSPIPSGVATGDRIWEFTAGAAVTSSPCLSDGLITVGCRDGHIYCLDAAGGELWRASGPGGIGSSPTAWEDRIIFGEYGGSVVAVDRTTGEELWRHSTGGKIVSSPTCEDGLVFVGSFDKNLHALDVATGEEVWTYTAGDAIWSSPKVAGELVVVGSLDRNVYGIRRTDGALLWRVRTAGPIYASPAVHGEDLFIGCRGGKLYRINTTTGETVWTADVGRSIHSTAAVVEDRLVFGVEEGSVICLSRETGELLWSFPTGARVPSSPAIRDGIAYVGSYDRYIYALDLESGHPIWRKEVGGSVYSSVRLSEYALYVGTNHGRLVALSLAPPGGVQE